MDRIYIYSPFNYVVLGTRLGRGTHSKICARTDNLNYGFQTFRCVPLAARESVIGASPRQDCSFIRTIDRTAPTHFPEEPDSIHGIVFFNLSPLAQHITVYESTLFGPNMGGNVTCLSAASWQACTCLGICHPPALNPRHRPSWPHRRLDPSHKLAILRHSAET